MAGAASPFFMSGEEGGQRAQRLLRSCPRSLCLLCAPVSLRARPQGRTGSDLRDSSGIIVHHRGTETQRKAWKGKRKAGRRLAILHVWRRGGAESTETFAIMSAFPLSTLCPCIFASPAARSNRFRSPRFFRNNCSPQRHRDTEESLERKTQCWPPPRHSSCLEKRGAESTESLRSCPRSLCLLCAPVSLRARPQGRTGSDLRDPSGIELFTTQAQRFEDTQSQTRRSAPARYSDEPQIAAPMFNSVSRPTQTSEGID